MLKKWISSHYQKYALGLAFLCILLIFAVFWIIPEDFFPGRSHHSAPPAIPPQWSDYDPLLGTMMVQVNESEIYQSTSDLQKFSTREYPSSGNEQAGQYLYSRLSTIPGLNVTYQDSPKKNIIATLPGKGPAPGTVIIAGAHYDSSSSDPEHAPGATDNGCGVASVLELARVMSTHTYNHTIVFAFWNAEETGETKGSMDYAADARKNSLDIPLYFNYDSSCYDPDHQNVLDIIYDEQSEPYAALLTRYNTLYSVNFTLTENVNTCDGDHLSFREEGYPALMTHSPLHADQVHSPDDTVDLISTGFARKNAQLGMLLLARTAEIQR